MADKKIRPAKKVKRDSSWQDRLFGAVVIILSIFVFVVIAYPLWFIIIASISNSNLVNLGKVTIWPKDILFYGYQQIAEDARIWTGYANTILYVVAGTILNMAVTMPAAYALSRRDFKARNKVMFYFVFTMFFSGGLVPLYMTVSSLGLISTKTILIIFVAVNTYNLIIARTFIETSIPEDLYEAAVLDGCSHFMFNSNSKNAPLQIILREILLLNQAFSSGVGSVQGGYAQGAADQVKYAVIIVSTLPILCVYPFIQKYFEKGVMIGAVKG
ncbi:MAG: carbohydrate ABC transporter permease [Clostridium sp.]|nr:carbohydrate ABC transporter permease [Clostridium sp.]